MIDQMMRMELDFYHFEFIACTTGTAQGADGRDLCRRQNIGAVGTARGSGRLRWAPSAQKSRRHSCRCADGHRWPTLRPRHNGGATVGTTWPSAQLPARWAQIVRPLTVSSCADGRAVGSDDSAMPMAYFFLLANLFIVSKNLNLFIYVLLSSIYTWETNVCPCIAPEARSTAKP
jgi:hypothetical protein